jgi:hypothetical protein
VQGSASAHQIVVVVIPEIKGAVRVSLPRNPVMHKGEGSILGGIKHRLFIGRHR